MGFKSDLSMEKNILQCVEKPRGYHSEWIPWVKTQLRPQGFWTQDFQRDSIHRDTLRVCPHIFILLSSRTSKEGFFSAIGLPSKLMTENTKPPQDFYTLQGFAYSEGQ